MNRASVRAALADALAIVLPVDCAGCGAADETLCASCRAALSCRPTRRGVDGLEVRSALPFDGVAARVLRAMKEDGRTSLARTLAPLLRGAAAEWGDAGLLVVPVPASPAAMRRRGFRATELLARRAGWHPRRVLRIVRRTADQRGLGRDQRAGNVAGSMRARPVSGERVLLVDDVITTGATLAEAARALREAGASVVGAVTVASTERRNSR